MKEIKDIVRSFREAVKQHKRAALATVVHVEGSSYRRPGARMLVTEDGVLTGAISGGCLEGDALRKAMLAINKQQNKLVRYDTNEEDSTLGIQLGCNGIVYILFEPIDPGDPLNPIFFLEKICTEREAAILITIFSRDNSAKQYGTALLYRPQQMEGNLPAGLNETMYGCSMLAFINRSSSLETFFYEDKELNAFVEYIEPPVSLIIAGAGNDVQPLVVLSELMGWQTTIIDGRRSHANADRFPAADKILAGKPNEILSKLYIDDKTVFVLMTHNYNYDMQVLEKIIESSISYIGILGPKKKLDRMIDELFSKQIYLNDQKRLAIHGPVGLDIGAETAQEIAVSIIGEIQAVVKKTTGAFLKDKSEPIHTRIPVSL